MSPERALLLASLFYAGCTAPRPAGEPAATPPAVEAPAARASGSIALEIHGFESDAGRCLVSLFVAPEGFPDHHERAYRTAELAIRDGRASTRFDDVPAGPFAVSVLDDEDRDYEIDKNFLGIPTERWGVTRGARPTLRPPTFEEARLELAAGEVQQVEVVVE